MGSRARAALARRPSTIGVLDPPVVGGPAMVLEDSLVALFVALVDRIPAPPRVPRRGRPPVYSDRLFLKALVVMVLKRLPTAHALLAVLDQPTPEMRRLRALLAEDGRFPARRTWERRLAAAPATLPAQIACLGTALVALLDPGARGAGRSPSTAPSSAPAAGSGTKSTATPGRCPTRRSTPRPTGPSRGGTAGSTAGNCTSS